MTLSERMILYRAKNKISQEKLAEMAGVSKESIYSFENERRFPNKVTLKKIELVIGKEDET